MRYILDKDHNPILMEDMDRWSEWMFKQNDCNGRVVEQDHLGPYFLSTVFLGLDHSFSDNKDPKKAVLFETMAFLNKGELFIRRYKTWDGSVKGHDKIRQFILEYVNSPKEHDIPWDKLSNKFQGWREDGSA